ncbi:hypothetical protein [Ehrlichia chaffeensis]|uniref:hypothetical protein n=1 Tax=Ehrlichia chaffeensis TaxID=945 RepID=UPI000444C684|nr:hypothetical protein [Ehrlichia chaffeensis]AHX07323.1 hypothetical protein ECHOSC_0902 [Ehrlichia chaffeensis str. Osceola]
MNNNIPITTNQASSFKLKVGENLHGFCNRNIYTVKITTEDNTEIVMPSKNYFFVGDKFYVPYNNYLHDSYLNIPSEYQYIKVERTQYTTYSKETQDFYNLVICDQNGEAYHYNYQKFYIRPENIIEKPETINLEEYYNVQKTRGDSPLFKISSEEPYKNTETSPAILLDLHSNEKFAKLSPESLQYKHYSSANHDTFIFNYSDISKHHINDDKSIHLHNIRDDVIQEEMENSPIFLVIQDGKFFFTDIEQEGSLVKDYNTALRVLNFANFQIQDIPNDNRYVNMHEKFIFKVVKSDLQTEYGKNFASVILEDKEIALIPNDDNTHLFFDGNFSFEYCNNVREVFKYDEPISGFTKSFAAISQEKLDSTNIYITIKSDEGDHTQTYFSDKQGNHILDLPNTGLTEYLSTILPLDYSQNETHNISARDITHQASETIQEHNVLDQKEDNTRPEKLIDTEHHTNEGNTFDPITEQDIDTIYFPLSKEHINIGDNIDQDKHHISFDLTYEGWLNFYEAIKENYSYDQVWSAYNNIFKDYGKEQENDNVYINQNNHIFIDNYDFGLVQ